MAKKVRLCNHNGRSGKNGVFNPNHNNRQATRADSKDKHINDDLSKYNLYWTWNGNLDFKKSEREFYLERYGKTIEERNKRYIAQGHKERCISVDDLLNNPKTAPQETILQIGDRDHMMSLLKYYGDEVQARQAIREILKNAVEDYVEKIQNDNVHVTDWAIHADEASIHCHLRVVFDYKNEKGERTISQNKALENLGIEPPEPQKPLGRFNNRKQTYDAKTRLWWLDAVKKALNRFKDQKVAKYLGNFELEPERGRKHRLEKNEYILMRQAEQIAKNNKLIQYQDAFTEFVKEAEAEELERQRQKNRERER